MPSSGFLGVTLVNVPAADTVPGKPGGGCPELLPTKGQHLVPSADGGRTQGTDPFFLCLCLEGRIAFGWTQLLFGAGEAKEGKPSLQPSTAGAVFVLSQLLLPGLLPGVHPLSAWAACPHHETQEISKLKLKLGPERLCLVPVGLRGDGEEALAAALQRQQ